MNDPVRDSWVAFNTPFEANAPFMYLDIKGYVTAAVGLLLENPVTHKPMPTVFLMPWRRNNDNTLASYAEVDEEWHNVKRNQHLRGHRLESRRAITTLYLTPEDVHALTLRKYDHDRAILKTQFPSMDHWPVPAQKGLHSMAWARGPYAFTTAYPKFTAACNSQRWDIAAAECKIGGEETNRGLKPRNDANRELFLAAQAQKADVIVDEAPNKPGFWRSLFSWRRK